MRCKLLTLVLVTPLLFACSTTLKTTELNAQGYFTTNQSLKDTGVEQKGEFKESYRTFLYLKPTGDIEKLDVFFRDSFENMQVFEQVLSQEQLEELVFEKDLADKVTSVSDKIGLHQLQKEIGPFLVVEPKLEWQGGYDYYARIKAYDPISGKNVLTLTNEAFNWDGLDQPLFYPLFNAFLQWTRGQDIASIPDDKVKEGETDYQQMQTELFVPQY